MYSIWKFSIFQYQCYRKWHCSAAQYGKNRFIIRRKLFCIFKSKIFPVSAFYGFVDLCALGVYVCVRVRDDNGCYGVNNTNSFILKSGNNLFETIIHECDAFSIYWTNYWAVWKIIQQKSMCVRKYAALSHPFII